MWGNSAPLYVQKQFVNCFIGNDTLSISIVGVKHDATKPPSPISKRRRIYFDSQNYDWKLTAFFHKITISNTLLFLAQSTISRCRPTKTVSSLPVRVEHVGCYEWSYQTFESGKNKVESITHSEINRRIRIPRIMIPGTFSAVRTKCEVRIPMH